VLFAIDGLNERVLWPVPFEGKGRGVWLQGCPERRVEDVERPERVVQDIARAPGEDLVSVAAG